jgi:hypothetical protein
MRKRQRVRVRYDKLEMMESVGGDSKT